ncbi:hypothetical protein ACLK1T_19525 [Escherichia coli]
MQRLQINMLMAAAVCAVIASNLGMFVVMAEIMALCAVFSPATAKRQTWFALGLWHSAAGDCLLAAVAALWHAGICACWDMRMQQLPLGSDIWLLGVIGFGLVAGIIRCTAGCRRHMLTPLRQLPRCFLR